MVRDKILKRIFFTDYAPGFHGINNAFLNILRKKYRLIITPENPDYVFFSWRGNSNLLYPNAVKICYLSENITPDFNLADYALGFDFIEFEDRYFRLPLCRYHLTNGPRQTVLTLSAASALLAQKTQFCNFCFSNSALAHPVREQMFHVLSAYKPVASGGGLLNNIGHRVKNKVAWQREFKFSIAFENSCKNGYTTEKVVHALQADTIPIYWGNPRVAEDINPERIINCHDFASLEDVVARVAQIDNDDKLYAHILAQPWRKGPTLPSLDEDEELAQFLYHIFDQPRGAAKRIPAHGNTKSYLAVHSTAFNVRPFTPAELTSLRWGARKMLVQRWLHSVLRTVLPYIRRFWWR